jgi:hypothetical protein
MKTKEQISINQHVVDTFEMGGYSFKTDEEIYVKYADEANITIGETAHVRWIILEFYDRTVVSYRGSANAHNWMSNTDGRTVKDKLTGLTFHRGFYDLSTQLIKVIAPLLSKDKPIDTTGLSLGGALSLVNGLRLKAMGYPVRTVYQGAAPKSTQGAYDKQIDTIRICVDGDIVCYSPSYGLFATTIFAHDGKGVVLYDKDCKEENSKNWMAGVWANSLFRPKNIIKMSWSFHNVELYLKRLNNCKGK